jgi:hypothetical protein
MRQSITIIRPRAGTKGRVLLLLALLYPSVTSNGQEKKPLSQAATSRGCAATTLPTQFKAKDDLEVSIVRLVKQETDMLIGTLAPRPVNVQWSPTLMNAQASMDPSNKTLTLVFGMPFMKLVWEQGMKFAAKPIDKEWLPQAAVRAIIYHEFGHLVQYALVNDSLYAKPEHRKHFELEADAIAGAYISICLDWDVDMRRAAYGVFFVLGDTEFNMPDPHGSPMERESAAQEGRKYVDHDKSGPIVHVASLHKDLFEHDYRPRPIADFNMASYTNSMTKGMEHAFRDLHAKGEVQERRADKWVYAIFRIKIETLIQEIGARETFTWGGAVGSATRELYTGRLLANRGKSDDQTNESLSAIEDLVIRVSEQLSTLKKE